MITGRDILYISSIEWDFLWQAHQEIARRLAAAGNRRALHREHWSPNAGIARHEARGRAFGTAGLVH